MSGAAGLSKASYDTEPVSHGRPHDPLDKKDKRTHPNTANMAQEEEKEQEKIEEEMKDRDPTELAKAHGNKPSRGAEIDEELKREDEQRMQEKGY